MKCLETIIGNTMHESLEEQLGSCRTSHRGMIISYHTCNIISVSMDQMSDGQDNELHMPSDYHREEGTKRKILDTNDDRMKLYLEFPIYPYPLKQDFDGALCNIVNCHVADMSKINVHNALQIGKHMASEFKDNMSETFYRAINSEVVTMETMTKGPFVRELSKI